LRLGEILPRLGLRHPLNRLISVRDVVDGVALFVVFDLWNDVLGAGDVRVLALLCRREVVRFGLGIERAVS
jgi:hypothetical protein